MRIWPDCIPCILKMSLGIARLAMKDEKQVKDFMERVLRLKYFSGKGWGVTSPEVIRTIWLMIVEASGDGDPMKEIKREQNSKALAIYPVAKEVVVKSNDPFLEAVKLAIAGNSIDAMTDVKGGAPEQVIKECKKYEIHGGNVDRLKEGLKRTRKLIYLGDNCGEIFYDKLLLEVLREMYHPEMIFVTRSLPILNDATLQDAFSAGIGDVAQIMENGISEPLPGTFLDKVSPALREQVKASDLIISKGGGNYDSLTEEEGLRGKVSFLFLAKCHPYCTLHGVPLNAPIVYNF